MEVDYLVAGDWRLRTSFETDGNPDGRLQENSISRYSRGRGAECRGRSSGAAFHWRLL